MKQVVWSQGLADAVAAIAADKTPSQWGDYVYRDVASRAREFKNLSVGQVLEPFQVEYVSCLRGRFDGKRESEQQFNTAWGKAYHKI